MKQTLIDNIPLIMMLGFLFGFPIVAPFLAIVVNPIIDSYDEWLDKLAERYENYRKKRTKI